MGGTELAPLDFVLLALLALALLRGLLRGLLRESFSLASLAAAVVVVKLYTGAVADRLLELTDGRIGEYAAPWAAGAILVVVTIGVVTLAGRMARRGARFAGLGWADRAGGAVLGTAEGLLVAGVVVALLGTVAGRSHPILAGSQSLAAFERFEQIATPSPPDVAAAPPP